jgi:ABC-2 type transport system permease protein
VMTRNHGAVSEDSIYLYVVVRCGGAKPIPPLFVDRGVPIEYELVRSICTLAQEKRKKLGVLTTDIPLYGGINFQTMSPTNNWPIIDELEKQYEVVRVDPSKPITEKLDVLFAVEPSSLGQQEMDNFIAAVESGVPTAIFEDPAAVSAAQGMNIPGTSAPRQAGGGMMMRQQPPPKGDIAPLWKLLGVSFADNQIIWQDYNPYRKLSYLSKDRELVFVDAACGNPHPFNPNDTVSAGLQQVLFLFPGAFVGLNSSKLAFTPLASTGRKTGYVEYGDLLSRGQFGQGGLNSKRRMYPTGVEYVMAARIRGKITLTEESKSFDDPFNAKKKPANPEKPKTREANVNVILVGDVDMLSDSIFRIRQQGDVPEAGVFFDFDNIPFVLNVLDSLAGDNRFLEIRKRRPKHRTLTRVDEHTAAAEKKIIEATEQFYKEQEKASQKLEDELAEKIKKLRDRPNVDQQQMLVDLKMKLEDLQRRNSTQIKQLQKKHEKEIQKSQAALARQVRLVQTQYKLEAVVLPPIAPLMVAIFVFFTRRAREREGVARSRLR